MNLNLLKGKIKLSKKHWIIFGFSFLIIVSSFLIYKNNYKEGFSFLGEWRLPFLVDLVFKTIERDFHKSEESEPIIVGREVVTWDELSQVLEFEKISWKDASGAWQITGLVFEKDLEKQKIIDLLVERKVIKQMVEEYKVSDLTEEEIDLAKTDLFGENYSKTFLRLNLEADARARTKALKEKIDAELIEKYTGALIHVKFRSPGATKLKLEEVNVYDLAKQKTEELYNLAIQGASVSEVLDMAEKDIAIQKLNNQSGMDVFKGITIDEITVPVPEVKQVMESLSGKNLSEVFEMTAIMDPRTEDYEHFAFGFVILDQHGDSSNLEILIQEFKQSLEIIINI